ncbi:MAG: TadA family conjugal transfer-associated ATPase [Propionibacteriaceae bacterium]|nr:TadA family conjugal transfer-associated ATPase [Propionibacteriaceae bacterium]
MECRQSNPPSGVEMVSEETVGLVRQHLALIGRSPTAHDIADALRATGQVVCDEHVLDVFQGISRDCVGLGILDPLLALEGITDIVVNGPHKVYVDQGHGLELTEVKFLDDEAVRQLAVRLAASVGRRLDDGSPFVDARLASGVRFHGILAGISHPGTCLSFRIPAKTHITFEDWIRRGGVDPSVAEILHRLIDKKIAFLVSGGTGSGKTTLLSSLLGLVPAGERLVVVEDSRELNPHHPHCIWLESRPANGEDAGLVTMTDLVRQALRMRPDRLVVGEVRGGELCDLLQALNTGHEGGCGTIHANCVADLPARLEALGALGGLSPTATHAQVASAFRVVIHLIRRGPVREVAQIGVLSRGSLGVVEAALAWSKTGDHIAIGEAMDDLKALLA